MVDDGHLTYDVVDAAPELDRAPAPARLGVAARMLAAVLYLAAAALAVVAPFLTVYSERFELVPDGSLPEQSVILSLDGWGRGHVTAVAAENFTLRTGPRFGVVLLGAAVVLVAAAGVAGYAAIRRGGPSLTWPVGLSASGAGAVLATGFLLWTFVASDFAGERPSLGPMLWLVVASGGCALAGSVVLLLARWRGRRRPWVPRSREPLSPLEADTEALP